MRCAENGTGNGNRAAPTAADDASEPRQRGPKRAAQTERGSNVLGSRLVAVSHLLSVLATQPDGTPLQAGEIVTTGTITTAHSVQAGETWRSELRGLALPGLTVEFSA